MSSNKVVRVSYFHEDFFCIPSNINLEDASQVEDWEVKWNELKIYLTNGEHLCIEAHIGVNDCSYKYPDGDSEIMDCDETGVEFDEDKFKPNDFKKPEEKPKEEVDIHNDEQLVCPYCERNEKECEKQTENEKNPITDWCGWGLSCDDCYYKNHPESDEEDEEDEDEEEEDKPKYDVVNKFEFEGKKYLRSKNSGLCYDFNKYIQEGEQVIVGKWNATTNKIDFQIQDREK